MLFWMVAQAIVFVFWVVLAFKLLFRLAARLRQGTGLMFPGPTAGLPFAVAFLRDPVNRPEIGRLLVVTGVLVAMTLGFAAMARAA